MRPSNFGFLDAQWKPLAKEARFAERYVRIDPRSSLLYARRGLEQLVDWLYEADATLGESLKDDLNSRLNAPDFKRLAGQTVLDKMHLIRKASNLGVHGKGYIDPTHAEPVVRDLFHVCMWLAHHYTLDPANRPAPATRFDPELLAPKPAGGVVRKTPEEIEVLAKQLEARDAEIERAREQRVGLEDELKELRRQVAEAKKAGELIPDNHDYSEVETRVYIDLYLREAGWPLDRAEDREYPVHTMPASDGSLTGRGFVDYVLWGADGKPLAVVEAKRTSRDPHVGKQQAKLYADCLERSHGQRPIIYYSNGYRHWIWDDTRYPEREVLGFHTRDELALMVDRRTLRKPLADAVINTDIAGRPYQQEAIRAITEAFEHDAERRALVVMATGTGKTRTVVALADLLQRARWVKRVLFLADRNALVAQAARAFKTNLPGSSPVVLGRDSAADAAGSRVHVATYPTMMNIIGRSTEGVAGQGEWRGVGYYDLVVVDEAHRSVYQKYRSIFAYFDALTVGLTATPTAQVDRNTYSLFNIQDHVPTFAYELSEAVADEYLVPPRTYPVPLKFPSEGIRYEDLSEDERDEWDALEWNDDGEIPDEVAAAGINKWLFNTDTVDKVLQVLMEHGHRVAAGDRLAKTIIFARNQEHAEFISQRFDANYPSHQGKFAAVITHQVNYAQSLINDFSDPAKNPHIAISVDMLDTGIDVPEVANLVFFKPVRSKTKFWQMIGRGTRLCPDLYGPGQDKQDFLVFDVCNNVEFFNADLGTAEQVTSKSLAESTFATRVRLLATARTAGVSKEFQSALVDVLRERVSDLPSSNFMVRPQLDLVEQFSSADGWDGIDDGAIADLEARLAPLATISAPRDTEEAKRFDLLLLQAELASLTDLKALNALRRRIVDIASALQDQSTIPVIKDQMSLIESLLEDETWQSVTAEWLEMVRRRLRPLVHLIEKAKRNIVYTNFVDELGDLTEVELGTVKTGTMDLADYRAQARFYLRENESHTALQRLRRGHALTALDLQELERMLLDSGAGSREDLDRASGGELGVFIRSLVGLDLEAVQVAFAEFIDDTTLTRAQLHLINLIVQHLTQNGTMTVEALYDAPFSDVAPTGPEGLFEPEPLGRIYNLIDRFNVSARLPETSDTA